MTEVLNRLSQWYLRHCNDDWEHQYGVKIDTIDNPGWSLKVDLYGTDLVAKEFQAVKIERSDSDWIQCRVSERQFEGFGGALNLAELIEAFLTWAETPNPIRRE